MAMLILSSLASKREGSAQQVGKIASEHFTTDVNKYTRLGYEKIERLKDLDLFVLDNSIRETTVGAIRGHTLDNKRLIYEEVKKCGFKYFIVGAFNNQTRVEDLFLADLIEKGEDLTNAVSFSEAWENIVDGVPQYEPVPVGLLKCKRFKINHVLFEIDLVNYKVDYDKFTMDQVCALVKHRIDWVRENLSSDSLILFNLRDFSDTMTLQPQRIWKIVSFLSTLPPTERIAGLAYEDVGKYEKDLLGGWTRAVRKEMLRGGWEGGELLFHQHEQWGTMHGDVLEVLGMGATGVWAGVCAEGAAMGHADSCSTILNLIRLGNKKVQKKFNCKHLRDAAINVTKIVTGLPPSPRQPIYGERAIDMVFGFVFSGLADDASVYTDGFDLAEFLGLEKTMRISNMANPGMILEKLNVTFGEDPQFTMKMAEAMKAQMGENLVDDGRKEEYNSQAGLAILFDQAGGQLTPKMSEIVIESTNNTPHINDIIAQIKEDWEVWDVKDGVDDDQISFDNFYKGFMAPYFGCYKCEDSQIALRCLDMDTDGSIDWFEFRTFLVWAGRQYPGTKDKQELLDHAFRHGLIPAMKDELDKMKEEKRIANSK